MYRWLPAYMHQVLALLAFHSSVKEPQLLLYLASLENLATYFFAYNRLDYAQNILECTAHLRIHYTGIYYQTSQPKYLEKAHGW